MREEIRDLCISPDNSIMKAIRTLDETHEKIVLVEREGRLLGVVTDSDIRRAILRGTDMEKPVSLIMTSKPICVRTSERHTALELMRSRGIDAVPVIDEDGFLADVVFLSGDNGEERTRKDRKESMDVPVVIMAGGKGTRLAPYTDVLPKPLIPVGKSTILEQVIDTFRAEGCSRFFLSVNYKKNLIKAFMQDLAPDYAVEYVEEENFLGTAGSLGLLKNRIQETFFVSNCDILLDIDYADVIRFHKKKGNAITMITSLKDYTIPYGVVNIDNEDEGRVTGLSEKPHMNFLVNTGVYVLEPAVLSEIPEGEVMHITHLMEKCMASGMRVGTYPVTENAWQDMGEMRELYRMIERQ